jgi:hypothetical protein
VGGCWWAAAGGRLLVGGCWWAAAGAAAGGRLLWAAAGVVVGKKPPKCQCCQCCQCCQGGRKRRCTVRSQKIEMYRDGMVECSSKRDTIKHHAEQERRT